MKDFLLLLKAMKANSANMVQKRDGTMRVRRSTLLPNLLTGILFGVVFGFSSVSDFFGLLSLGVDSAAVGEYFCFCFAFYLLYSFFMDCAHIVNNFFMNNDSPFIPLPIKSGKLFLARFILSFVYCFSSSFFCLAAVLIGYALLVRLEAGLVVLVFLLSLFLTIGLFSVAFLFVNLLYRLFGRGRTKQKNVVFSLTFSLISVLPLLVPMLIPLDLSSLSTAMESLEACRSFLPFVEWISFLPTALFFPSALTWLWTSLSFLISILFFALDYLFGSRLYLLNRSLGGERKKKAKARQDSLRKEFSFQARHPYLFLLRRELSNYRGHLGLVVSAVSTSALVLLSMVITLTSLSMTDSLSELSPSLLLLVLLSMVYFSSYQPLFSYSSLSLEGTGILVLQSSPLKKGPYLLAKIVLGTSVSFLFSLVLLLSYGFTFALDPLSFVFSALSLLAYALVANFISLILGIRFAQFSYDNATEIVRRGIGPTLSSLILFFLPAAALAIEAPFLLIVPSLPFLGPLVMSALFSLLACLLYRLAKKMLQRKLSSLFFL